jgi:hypothetical protein
MSKARGQSRARALRKGKIDHMGRSLRRPFNNKKRTKGRKMQVNSERFYRYMKARLSELKELKEDYDKITQEEE